MTLEKKCKRILASFFFLLCISVKLSAQENTILKSETSEEWKKSRLEYNRPNYFIFDGSQHEMQFSAKYRVILTSDPALEEWTKFYFAYTQKAIWKPNGNGPGNSENFLYSNYNPDVFYAYNMKKRFSLPIRMRLGYEHESDGLGKQFDSIHHEWDRLYLQSSYGFFEDQFTVSLKIWHAYIEPKYNPDITKCLGYGELNFKTSLLKKYLLSSLELTVRKGTMRNTKDFGFFLEQHYSLFDFSRWNYKIPINFVTGQRNLISKL